MTTEPTQAVTVTQEEKSATYKQAYALATSCSEVLPKRWHNKPAEVYAMMLQAQELGIEKLTACRLTYPIQGQPTLKAEAVIGLVNARGNLGSEIMFEERGELMRDDYAVRAYAISSKTGERLEGIWVGMDMVKAEAWGKSRGTKYSPPCDYNPKYDTPMRAQMLRYRAATFWARLYAPQCMMGMQTDQEVREVYIEKPAVDEAVAAVDALLQGGAPEQEEATDAAFTPVEETPLDEDGEPNEFIGHTELFPDSGKTEEDPG